MLDVDDIDVGSLILQLDGKKTYNLPKYYPP